MIEFQKTSDSRTALAVSVAVHIGILLWILLCLAFTVPDPPIDSGMVSVSLADFGFDNSGSGEVESESVSENQSQEEVSQTQPQPTETAAEEVITQETSTVSTQTSTSQTTQETTQEAQVSSELSNILGQIGETSGGSSEGATTGTGNEGIESGSIDGKGIFDGGGWELSGRGIVGYPTLDEKPKEEGRVVLDIYVDRNGNVIESKVNFAKTNTSSLYLHNLAKEAAKSARFNVKSNAPPKQKGSLTFIFKLN